MDFSAKKVLGEIFSICNEEDVLLPASQIETDSRKVVPGVIFVAVPGVKCDGRTFIAEAIQKGAAAIVCSGDKDPQIPGAEKVIWCKVTSARNADSRLYRHFYGYPDEKMRIY